MEYINLKAGMVMRESLKMIYLKVKEKSYTIEEHGMYKGDFKAGKTHGWSLH